MPSEVIERISEIIIADSELTKRLFAIESEPEFASKVVEIGAVNGIEISVDEVIAEIRRGKIDWIERSIPIAVY